MSNYPGGYGPGHPPQGYPGYQGYQAYPGYPGYPPQGYWQSPVIKPGIIALRPLNLSDIYNGAIAYVRANPKATLGLTTIVVVTAQLVVLALQIGPLAFAGGPDPLLTGADAPGVGALIGYSLGSLAGAVTTWLSAVLLSGLLTVIVGRAVFGAGITIGEAWQRLRGRVLALLGFTALEALGAILLVGVAIGVIAVAAYAVSDAAAFLVGAPLVLGLIALLTYLGTMLSFVPPLIVLERLSIMAAIARSFALVKRDFWRVLGIRLLAMLVAGMIAGAVSMPFSFGGQMLLLSGGSGSRSMIGLVLVAIGSAIGQIITAPFTAGVVVLQYADRRIRAEAFDLILQTGAARGPAPSTDHLWLIRQP